MKENEVVEFKQELTNSIEKEIIAFLNTYGGTIYLGYDDSGMLIGLVDAKADELALASRIKNNISPAASLFVSIKVESESNKEYIIIQVSKGTDIYYLSRKDYYTGTYVRSGTTTILASKETVKNLIMKNNNITFETSISAEQELTFNYAAKLFAEKNIDIYNVSIQKSLKLRNSKGFLNLALLISDQNPFSIKVAVYPDEGKSEFLDRKDFSGSIFESLNKTVEYLKLNTPVYGIIVGLRRQDTESFPEKIIREAILNSIIHRDYSMINSNIINLYQDNSMEILNVGTLYGELSIKDILSGVSSSRNPNLQSICMRLELGDSLGKGLRTINSFYKNHKLEINILVNPASFILTLPKIKKEINDIGAYVTISEYTADDAKKTIKKFLIENASTCITRKIAEMLIGKSKTQTASILKEMVHDNILISEGSGPSTRYTLK